MHVLSYSPSFQQAPCSIKAQTSPWIRNHPCRPYLEKKVKIICSNSLTLLKPAQLIYSFAWTKPIYIFVCWSSDTNSEKVHSLAIIIASVFLACSYHRIFIRSNQTPDEAWPAAKTVTDLFNFTKYSLCILYTIETLKRTQNFERPKFAEAKCVRFPPFCRLGVILPT